MTDTPKHKPFSDTQVLRRNLLVSFVLVILLIALYATVPGYNYVVKDVAIHNKELMDHIQTQKLNLNLPEITTELKREFRMEDYFLIKTMMETPENSVILLPPVSAVDTSAIFKELSEPEVMEYYLYPRLCISEDEKDKKKDLYAKVTHVAIVNGWGYDKLHYTPPARPSEAVLSIEQPRANTAKKPEQNIKPFYLKDSANNNPKNMDQH
ncbi:MAG: hypothetical protein JWO03_3030 [Bacteroidetes bacterium]|nr:hypothetical protein [Bacteroidota bacterium]